MSSQASDAAAAGAEDPWATAAAVLADRSGDAVVQYYFPVQIEVIEPTPVDHDAIADQALHRLTQQLEGR